MNIRGLFRCKANNTYNKFNFFLMQLARNENQELIWELVDEYRDRYEDWQIEGIPLIRDLTDAETSEKYDSPLCFYESDLEAFK